jgi:hypothetical protein
LAACAVSSPITDSDSGESEFDKALIYDGERRQIQPPLPNVKTHRIFHQASTGFTPPSAIRSSAMKRVEEFCGYKGMEPYLIEETTSKPPHILGNWPRIEIVFSCVKSKKQETMGSPKDKYDQLEQLKSLLDDGAITQQEYENEKRKILGQ